MNKIHNTRLIFDILKELRTSHRRKMMHELVCIDCLIEFEDIDMVDKAYPNCGSTHFDYYDDVFEDDGED